MQWYKHHRMYSQEHKFVCNLKQVYSGARRSTIQIADSDNGLN